MLKHERGFGLIEVLVALMLLAVAVLGFSALQMRAIQATDETLTRSDAMVMIRNISEDMRLYPTATQKAKYITAITNATPQADDKISASKDCTKKACQTDEQIEYNAWQAKRLAAQSGIKLSAVTCPELKAADLQRVCIVAAWGDTEASLAGGANDCADTNGVYKAGSSCIVMETY